MLLQEMELSGAKYYMAIAREGESVDGGGEGGATGYTLGIFMHGSGKERLHDGKTYLRHSYIIPVQRVGSDMLFVQHTGSLRSRDPLTDSVGWGFASGVTTWLKVPRLLYSSKGKQYITIGVHLESAEV